MIAGSQLLALFSPLPIRANSPSALAPVRGPGPGLRNSEDIVDLPAKSFPTD